MHNKQIIAGFICLCFIMLSVFSFFFSGVRNSHDCCGHGCPVCKQIHRVEKSLRSAAFALIIVFGFSLLDAFICNFLLPASNTISNSLVSQKVRINS